MINLFRLSQECTRRTAVTKITVVCDFMNLYTIPTCSDWLHILPVKCKLCHQIHSYSTSTTFCGNCCQFPATPWARWYKKTNSMLNQEFESRWKLSRKWALKWCKNFLVSKLYQIQIPDIYCLFNIWPKLQSWKHTTFILLKKIIIRHFFNYVKCTRTVI